MKRLLAHVLRVCAQLIVRKYRPTIIAVAGSVGKTSTKEAVFIVVSSRDRAGKSIKNYNNELGVPLSIIGAYSGGRHILAWIHIFLRALRLIIVRDTRYPQTLVLEYGVDHIGDMAYLHTIAQPHIGVLTAVAEEHLEFLGDLEGVFSEEKQIVTRIPREGWAVLNFDDLYARSLIEVLPAQTITYGFAEGAMLRATDMITVGLEHDYCSTQYEWECLSWGTQFKVSYKGSTVPVFLPHCLGKQHVYAALAGIAVGLARGMNLVLCAHALEQYVPTPGRMRLLAGVKHTLIIDDTYNSSPQAVRAALDILKEIPVRRMGNKKWVILSDMRELGSSSHNAHQAIGEYIAQCGIDRLVVVGPESAVTAQASLAAGMSSDHITHVSDAESAGRYAQDRIEPGDILLIKGSQFFRMERVVRELMADPQRAGELLVRQGSEWEDV